MTDTDPPDRRRRLSLRTSRMEALSDGIFAIAATLLVLDLVIPAVTSKDVGHKLAEQWPTYVAYLVSFATIGNAWLNHSVITEYLDRADAILLRLNLMLLFFVSVLPFPTHMLAEYLSNEGDERIAVTILRAQPAGHQRLHRHRLALCALAGAGHEGQLRSGRAGPHLEARPQPGLLRGGDRHRAVASGGRGGSLLRHRPVHDHPLPDRPPGAPAPEKGGTSTPTLMPGRPQKGIGCERD
jgi:transmembrane protein TMEM174 (potassium channel)